MNSTRLDSARLKLTESIKIKTLKYLFISRDMSWPISSWRLSCINKLWVKIVRTSQFNLIEILLHLWLKTKRARLLLPSPSQNYFSFMIISEINKCVCLKVDSWLTGNWSDLIRFLCLGKICSYIILQLDKEYLPFCHGEFLKLVLYTNNNQVNVECLCM